MQNRWAEKAFQFSAPSIWNELQKLVSMNEFQSLLNNLEVTALSYRCFFSPQHADHLLVPHYAVFHLDLLVHCAAVWVRTPLKKRF